MTSNPHPIKMTVTAQDLRIYTRVRLRNGLYATLMDHARGSSRWAEIEDGDRKVTGRIYSREIREAFLRGSWVALDKPPRL